MLGEGSRISNLSTYSTFYMIDGEEQLVEQAVGGNSSAFGSLYDHYHPAIYRFIAIKVSSREEAEDITHHVFLSAWTKIRTYKHRGHPFSSWLYQIARNLVIDHYRSKKNDISLDKIDPESSIIPAVTQFDIAEKLQLEKCPPGHQRAQARSSGCDHHAIRGRSAAQRNGGGAQKK